MVSIDLYCTSKHTSHSAITAPDAGAWFSTEQPRDRSLSQSDCLDVAAGPNMSLHQLSPEQVEGLEPGKKYRVTIEAIEE